MPFDPSQPATNSPLSSAVMRSQLTSLNTEIQQRVSAAELATAIAGTSSNSNAVVTLNGFADGVYNQTQMQDVMNKLDELINTLRRTSGP